MLKTTKKLVELACKNLQIKTRIRWVIKVSNHFEERMLQRFTEEEMVILEKVVEKALEKSEPGQTRYTHPHYGYTVVINKLGLNGGELVTCYKGDEC